MHRSSERRRNTFSIVLHLTHKHTFVLRLFFVTFISGSHHMPKQVAHIRSDPIRSVFSPQPTWTNENNTVLKFRHSVRNQPNVMLGERECLRFVFMGKRRIFLCIRKWYGVGVKRRTDKPIGSMHRTNRSGKQFKFSVLTRNTYFVVRLNHSRFFTLGSLLES